MTMPRVSARLVASATVLLTAALALQASAPKYFQSSTQVDVLRGDADLVSIDEFGRLLLGPSSRRVYDATVPFVWCLAPGPDGSVYAGTGNDGQVVRVDRQGGATVVFDAPEAEVHALAVNAAGVLFAATSPDGRVYRIDAPGRSTVVFDPEDKYIWQLTVDAQGALFVAAGGEKGHVYRIPPGGTAARFYTAPATHVTAMAFDAQGRLIVGTESPGRVVRIGPDGKGFVLLDSPFREIKAIRGASTPPGVCWLRRSTVSLCRLSLPPSRRPPRRRSPRRFPRCRRRSRQSP